MQKIPAPPPPPEKPGWSDYKPEGHDWMLWILLGFISIVMISLMVAVVVFS